MTRQAWVVRGPNDLWLGGRRHDEGPLWRLFRKGAARYRTRQDAEAAAQWSGGTVEDAAEGAGPVSPPVPPADPAASPPPAATPPTATEPR